MIFDPRIQPAGAKNVWGLRASSRAMRKPLPPIKDGRGFNSNSADHRASSIALRPSRFVQYVHCVHQRKTEKPKTENRKPETEN